MMTKNIKYSLVYLCLVYFLEAYKQRWDSLIILIFIVAFSLKGTTSENILQYSPLPITTRSHIEDYPKRWLEKI